MYSKNPLKGLVCQILITWPHLGSLGHFLLAPGQTSNIIQYKTKVAVAKVSWPPYQNQSLASTDSVQDHSFLHSCFLSAPLEMCPLLQKKTRLKHRGCCQPSIRKKLSQNMSSARQPLSVTSLSPLWPFACHGTQVF